MANFNEPSQLALTGNSRTDLKNWVEGMIPTTDLIDTDQLNISSGQIGLAPEVPRWKKYSLVYTDFDLAATTEEETIVSLGAGAIVHAVKLVTTTTFAASGLSAMTADIGTTSGTPTEYISAANVLTKATTSGNGTFNNITADSFLDESNPTPIYIELNSTGANMADLTAGALDVWILYSITQSTL